MADEHNPAERSPDELIAAVRAGVQRVAELAERYRAPPADPAELHSPAGAALAALYRRELVPVADAVCTRSQHLLDQLPPTEHTEDGRP